MSVRHLHAKATLISSCDSLQIGVVVLSNHPTNPLTLRKMIGPFP